MKTPKPTENETELRNTIYSKLDHLAEGAHRAYGTDMYSGWIEEYTNEFLALITSDKQRLLNKARLDTIDKVFEMSPTTQFKDWKAQDAMEFYQRLKAYESSLSVIQNKLEGLL